VSIKIIAAGKTRKNYLLEGIAEFEKRLQKYTRIKLIELPDIKTTEANIEKVIEQEAEQILSRIKPSEKVIALDEKGKAMSTVMFARYLENELRNDLVFCIGGVNGTGEKVKRRADLILSFSGFTFTHQMIRLLLYEQLYRVFNYLEGGKYHK